MRSLNLRPVIGAAVIVAAAGILAGGLALKPVLAADGSFKVGPFTVIHCVTGAPCQTYSNQGTGSGVEGINTNKSFAGSGVVGSATGNGTGVTGSGTDNNGVSGYSASNAGVNGGTSSGWAVYGYTFDGTGVYGQSVNADGGDFFSSYGLGLTTADSTSIPFESISESSSPAISALGSTGDGIDTQSDNSGGYVLNVDNTAYEAGDGIVTYGYYLGAVTRAEAGSGYPFLATDQNNSDLAYIDGNGNMYVHGGYGTFSKTRNGNVVNSFAPRSTSPTVEDNGTAHMAGGVAMVQLNSAFADSIDTSRAYQVMLTPDGDTRGLYVASKTPTGFVVREVQGGRGTLDFDYHIYAPALGQATTHMVEMSQAQAASFQPHAPTTKIKFIMPTVHTKNGLHYR